MEKRVLFLTPGMDGPVDGNAWPPELERRAARNRWRVVTPSLLLLAAMADRAGWAPTVVDEDFAQVDWTACYDLVCMYTVTPNARRAYRYAERFRQKGAWVALGGVHAAMRPSESARFADTLLLGEGEEIFPAFLKDFELGRPLARYEQRRPVDLTRSPTPLYGALRRQEQRLIPMQTSRGCPRGCRFCNVRALYGEGFRVKTQAQLERELEAVCALPVRGQLYITNDKLMGSTDHFRQLCALLQNSARHWYANADISFGQDETLIRLAYQSGLRQVLIGLEGVTEAGLRGMDRTDFKLRHLKRYRDYIQRIQSNGIGVTGSFIVGGLHDTPDTFAQLAEFIESTHLFAASVTVSTPYPGTELYRQMDREGRIASYDWNDYTIFQPVMPGLYLSMEEIRAHYQKLLYRIHSPERERDVIAYFQPIVHKLRQEASPEERGDAS